MLPIQGSALPASASALEAALVGGLSAAGLASREVRAEDAGYPQLARLRVDLTGTSVEKQPPLIKPGQPQAGTVTASQLEVVAQPLLVSGAPIQLHLTAKDATLQEHTADRADRVLVLQRATDGHLSVEVPMADLQRLVLMAAKEASKQHGADIADIKLNLQATGDRTLQVASEVVAKFGFLKATLNLTGKAELDDALQLRLSNLDVQGSGMAAGLATTFIRPQLEKVERQPISLAALSLGEVKLRDVRVSTGRTLRVEAAFGS